MNWEAISALGQLLGAVVVMVSLIYLALQVKAATLQAEGSAHAEWFYSWNETLKGWTADESIMQTLRQGFDDFGGLSKSQKSVFSMQMAAALNHWELAGDLSRRGLIPRPFYDHVTEWMLMVFSTPGALTFLEGAARGFPNGPDLLSRVRSGQGRLPLWTEIAPWWSESSDEPSGPSTHQAADLR